jgi:RHS repeat-associated protein
MRFGYEVTLDKGWLAFSAASLERYQPAYNISRKTYFLGGQAIATRISGDPAGNNGLFYIHSDHLGSTSLMSDSGGALVADSVARYLPYGGWRTEPTAALTDRAFTGQKHNMDIGLYYYNARYYAPGTGRFISADTIVPDPTNPQQFNRYSYVLNNPLRFTDPTGHCAELDHGCWMFLANNFCPGLDCSGPDGWRRWIIAGGDSIWEIEELVAVRKTLLIAKQIGQEAGLSLSELFDPELRIKRGTECADDFACYNTRTKTVIIENLFWEDHEKAVSIYAIGHELGHAISHNLGGNVTRLGLAYDALHGEREVSLTTWSSYGLRNRSERWATAFGALVFRRYTEQYLPLPGRISRPNLMNPRLAELTGSERHALYDNMYKNVLRVLQDPMATFGPRPLYR